MTSVELYYEALCGILDATESMYSIETPSQYYESRMWYPDGSAIPGKMSYDPTPFWREVADCFWEYHPAEFITVMGGAQGGKTAAFIMAAIAYIIGIAPGNTLFLTGHSDLSEEAMDKVDFMIQQCDLQHKIKPQVVKAKGGRTGDTVKEKVFDRGNLAMGSVTNDKLLRQRDKRYIFVDDFSAATMFGKSGNRRQKVINRTAAFKHNRKIAFISSPERVGTCNIYASFLLSDQRYYHVPCPCCGEMIVLHWTVPFAHDDMKNGAYDRGGIWWKTDPDGNLDRDTVGYVCQMCAGFFTSDHKAEMNLAGKWIPTVKPKEPNHYGYQYSNLYAPAGFADWADHVQTYLNANPDGIADDTSMQTFNNEVLGIPHKTIGESAKAAALQKNCRSYKPGELPEALSIKDGNGPIVLITCAADMNGTMEGYKGGVMDDARLDWEIVAWAASGASYSLLHGSIGTFIPGDGPHRTDPKRVRWTYDRKKPNNVWDPYEVIRAMTFKSDLTGREMPIAITGLDTGYLSNEFGWPYIDSANGLIVGIKGDDEEKYLPNVRDEPTFAAGKSRHNQYISHNNKCKDNLSGFMKLRWAQGEQDQPPNFMNYPQPNDGMYTYEGFFKQYEAEHRIPSPDGKGFRWEKKNSAVQNHFWDVRLYNYTARDIYASKIMKELDQPKQGFPEYAALIRAALKQKYPQY